MEQHEAVTGSDARRANRVAVQWCLLHACVLESALWNGYIAVPPGVLEELEAELQARRVTARELRKQVRMTKRAAARLDLPEQIW